MLYIMPSKVKLLLSALHIITTLTCILSLNTYALDKEKKRGLKGPLCGKATCKDELLMELEEVQKYIKKLEALKKEFKILSWHRKKKSTLTRGSEEVVISPEIAVKDINLENVAEFVEEL